MEKTYYETHLIKNSELPVIFHLDILENEKSSANYHENVEILYFIEGSGSVECNFANTDVNAGDIFIINSNDVHCIQTHGLLKYYCLITDREFLALNGIDIIDMNFKEKITDKKLSEIYEKLVHELWGAQAYKNTAAKSCILELFVYIARNFTQEKNARKTAKLSAEMAEAIQYISANFKSRITVDDAAKKAGLSKYHFIRQFKKLTDYTLIEYINLLRCEHAKKMLSASPFSVKEIGELCGFENFSYFSKTFKKCIGLSPSEYRESKKNKKNL